MKNNLFYLIAAVLGLSGCSAASHYSSAVYQDGLYYRPSAKLSAVSVNTDKELDELQMQTEESAIFVTKDGSTSIVLPENKMAKVEFNTDSTIIRIQEISDPAEYNFYVYNTPLYNWSYYHYPYLSYNPYYAGNWYLRMSFGYWDPWWGWGYDPYFASAWWDPWYNPIWYGGYWGSYWGYWGYGGGYWNGYWNGYWDGRWDHGWDHHYDGRDRYFGSRNSTVFGSRGGSSSIISGNRGGIQSRPSSGLTSINTGKEMTVNRVNGTSASHSAYTSASASVRRVQSGSGLNSVNKVSSSRYSNSVKVSESMSYGNVSAGTSRPSAGTSVSVGTVRRTNGAGTLRQATTGTYRATAATPARTTVSTTYRRNGSTSVYDNSTDSRRNSTTVNTGSYNRNNFRTSTTSRSTSISRSSSVSRSSSMSRPSSVSRSSGISRTSGRR